MDVEDAQAIDVPSAVVAAQSSAMQLPPAAHPAELLRVAVEKNYPLDMLQKLMDLQDRWEANQAKKAYSVAMARFKENHIKVVKSARVSQGPLSGQKYAKLHDFVNASSEPLSGAGLSTSWKLTRDEPAWIEVACIVRHVEGHEEERRMGGAPDVGGSKNAIQARASTVSYLEKYTLKMALGLAEEDDDDDGQGGASGEETPRKPPAQTPPPTAERPEYAADAFDRNFPKWAEAIKSGKKNHGQIITMAETRGKLTDEQKKKIREVKIEAAE